MIASRMPAAPQSVRRTTVGTTNEVSYFEIQKIRICHRARNLEGCARRFACVRPGEQNQHDPENQKLLEFMVEYGPRPFNMEAKMYLLLHPKHIERYGQLHNCLLLVDKARGLKRDGHDALLGEKNLIGRKNAGSGESDGRFASRSLH